MQNSSFRKTLDLRSTSIPDDFLAFTQSLAAGEWPIFRTANLCVLQKPVRYLTADEIRQEFHSKVPTDYGYEVMILPQVPDQYLFIVRKQGEISATGVIYGQVGTWSVNPAYPDLFISLNRFMMALYPYVEPEPASKTCHPIKYIYKGPLGKVVEQTRLVNRFNDLIDDLYTEVKPDTLVKEFLESRESNLFLCGEPGVGKSTILRYLVNHLIDTGKNAGVVWYVKDKSMVSEDNFWVSLMVQPPLAVIFDDCGDLIRTQPSGKRTEFVNRFLSISDGILDLRTKFIFTANLEKSDVEDALSRPGRCYDFINMKPLTWEKATQLWTSLMPTKPGLLEQMTSRNHPVTEVMYQSLFRQIYDEVVNEKPRTYRL